MLCGIKVQCGHPLYIFVEQYLRALDSSEGLLLRIVYYLTAVVQGLMTH